MRKSLLILITHKQPTGTKDLAVYVAACALLWKERSNQRPSLLL